MYGSKVCFPVEEMELKVIIRPVELVISFYNGQINMMFCYLHILYLLFVDLSFMLCIVALRSF